jgi:putative PIN family toxin of toxin-antitoxin system
MIGVVLDTNVVVSALLNDEGAEATVLDLALTGELRLFASEAVLEEYEATLSRPKFAISSEHVQELMAALRTVAVIVAPGKTLAVSGHKPDNRFIECADAAQAEFLVTGNKRHFPAEWKTTRIVNSREFFDWIDLEESGS